MQPTVLLAVRNMKLRLKFEDTIRLLLLIILGAITVPITSCVAPPLPPPVDYANTATVFLHCNFGHTEMNVLNLRTHKFYEAKIDDKGWMSRELPKGRYLISSINEPVGKYAGGMIQSWYEVRIVFEIPNNGEACYVGHIEIKGNNRSSLFCSLAEAEQYFRSNILGRRSKMVTELMKKEIPQ